MNLLLRAGALALAIFAALPAAAQSTASSVQAPAGYAPMIAPCVKQVDGTCVPVSVTNPLPLSAIDARTAAASISAADVGTSSTAGQSGVLLVTGTPTASSFLTFAINAQSSGSITATGTFSLIAQVEASFDNGLTYVATSGLLRGTSTTTSSITGPGVLSLDVTGATHLRVRATSFTSGSMSIAFTASPAPGMTKVLNALKQLGITETDQSITSLSSGQAAGTSTILAANASRRALMIMPPADCYLTISSGATTGWKLFAGVPNSFPVELVPVGALYISGLSATNAVTVWEGQ